MSEYNGWSSYPTWAVNLWLTNEYPGIPEGATAEALAESVQAIVDSIELPGMLTDLLWYALEEVNWQEIADDNA